MLRLSRSAYRRCCFAAFQSEKIALNRRYYAQAASTPPPGRGDKKQEWQRPAPHAAAQTLTLFSDNPRGLLVALRSTLEGLISAAARTGPTPGGSAVPDAKHEHVLLYALSKDLPKDVLSEAVSLLRGSSADSSNTVARVGVLSSSIPASFIPESVQSPNAPLLDPDSQIHSVALSLLPGTHAIPFRSTVRGRAPVQIGRWPNAKQSWHEHGKRSDGLDTDAKGGTDASWQDLWGKENAAATLPTELQNIPAGSILCAILFSDLAPQGLLEGLDVHFPGTPVIGLTAPPTPFDTGRSQTLLMTRGDKDDTITEEGAVGIALLTSTQTAWIPAFRTAFEGLTPLGPRRKITSARGNIVSALAGTNATQQFLRDIAARNDPQRKQESLQDEFKEDKARGIANTVRKEDNFFFGVFESETKEEPLLVSQIMSGHPTRGSLSIDTESELGPGPGRDEEGNLWGQFYESNAHARLAPLDIPGPDPTVWATPRYLFLSLPSSSDEISTPATPPPSPPSPSNTKPKMQVMALPNMFVAASVKGWLGRSAVTEAMSGVPLATTSQTCAVPLAGATLGFHVDRNQS